MAIIRLTPNKPADQSKGVLLIVPESPSQKLTRASLKNANLLSWEITLIERALLNLSAYEDTINAIPLEEQLADLPPEEAQAVLDERRETEPCPPEEPKPAPKKTPPKKTTPAAPKKKSTGKTSK